MSADDEPLALLLAQVAWRKLGLRGSGVPQNLTDEQLLKSIVTFESMSAEVIKLQHDTVCTARTRGVSWSQIGNELGVSRQSVQQRFGGDKSKQHDPSVVLIGPVSRADEISTLEAAGQLGWKLQTSRHGEHSVKKTSRKWAVRRGSVLSVQKLDSAHRGWEVATVRFPDVFYVRDQGAL